MVGTGLKRIRRCQQSVELWIHPQPYVDITVRLELEAVDGAAHRHAPIDHPEPTRQVDPREWRTPVSLARGEAEISEENFGGRGRRGSHPPHSCEPWHRRGRPPPTAPP